MKRFNCLLIGSVVLCLSIVLLAGCGVSKSDYEALQTENADLTAELAATQSDLASLQADYDALNADYEAASSELAQFETVYPPRHFSSETELRDWLAADNISDRHSTNAVLRYASALELQERALEDGYIINAYIWDSADGTFTVFCDAVTEDDSLYWWYPESDEIFYMIDINYL